MSPQVSFQLRPGFTGREDGTLAHWSNAFSHRCVGKGDGSSASSLNSFSTPVFKPALPDFITGSPAKHSNMRRTRDKITQRCDNFSRRRDKITESRDMSTKSCIMSTRSRDNTRQICPVITQSCDKITQRRLVNTQSRDVGTQTRLMNRWSRLVSRRNGDNFTQTWDKITPNCLAGSRPQWAAGLQLSTSTLQLPRFTRS